MNNEKMSLREVRRELRRLPRDRRKDVLSAIRAGREVSDPRDAALAVAWAERLDAARWPSWVMPRTRPHRKRAWLWLLHVAWVVAALVIALATLWSSIPDALRWVIVGVLGYSAIGTPIVMTQTLRAYWSAPAAAESNRKLVDQHEGQGAALH